MKWFVFEWARLLGNYLIRWRLDFWFFSIRLHKWICSDDMRAYHDHPVNFLILILWGSYTDHYITNKETFERTYKAPCLRLFKSDYRHFVEVLSKPTWTLLLTWGAPKKWAFWDKHSLKRKNRDKYFIEEGHHICD